MITKTISSGQRSATVTISEETKFIFPNPWQAYHIKNLGTGNMYAALYAGAEHDGDGVTPILPGEVACTSHNSLADTVYITADNPTDKAFVMGKNSELLPFKSARNSNSGGDGTVFGLIGLSAEFETPIEGIIEEVLQP